MGIKVSKTTFGALHELCNALNFDEKLDKSYRRD